MDEHALIRETERANLAKQITDNPLWSEFFETLENNLIDSWQKSTSPEYREDAWRHMQVVKQMKKFMETALQTGKMAEMALAEMQEKQDGRKH